MKLTTDIIRLSEVLKLMDAGERFDITYCTADEQKGTGGEIKIRTNCRQTGEGRETAKAKKSAVAKKQVPLPTGKPGKNPNHFANATRNIILVNGQTRTVCIYLILFFNGKKVII